MTCRATECPRHSQNQTDKRARVCVFEMIAGQDGNVCKHPRHKAHYEAAEAKEVNRQPKDRQEPEGLTQMTLNAAGLW